MATAGTYKNVPINAGTDAQIAAQVAAINAGQKTTPVTPIPVTTTPPAAPTNPTTTSTTTSPTIPLSTLTTPPATPAVPTPPVTTTDSAGAQGALTSTQAQFQSTLDQNAATAKTNEQTSLDAYVKSQLGADTQAGLTDKAYAKTVDPAQKELNDANNALTAEQVALRHQIAKIQANNPKGIGSEVAQAQIDQLTRDSVSKQADLAVVQLAKQGAYDSAKAIADRAVNAEFEAQQAHNDALKFSYEENKDLFTTADQRAFDVAQADRQSQLDEAKAKRMADYNEKIQENSPLYKAQVANQYSEIQSRNNTASNDDDVSTYAKAYQLGQVPLTQIPQKIRGQVLAQAQATGTNQLTNLLTQYKDKINGLNLITANYPSNKAAIDSLKGQITAQYKQQQQLGTLDNGVQTLVDKIIPDPTKLSISSLNPSAQIAAIDTFIANSGGAGSSKVSDVTTNKAGQVTAGTIGGISFTVSH